MSEPSAQVRRAAGNKCARCWRVLQEVGSWADYPDLCLRCTDAVLLQETGYDLHHHATLRWDKAYCAAIADGKSQVEAERLASLHFQPEQPR